MTERQTVAGAYAKIEGHEELCAERYANIHNAIADLKLGARWIIGLLATVAIGLIGWLGVQVYDLNRAEVERAPVRPAMVSADATGPDLSRQDAR